MKASVKYKVIYRHKDIYPISEMCRFFEVSRSGYYDFVNRLDIPAKDLLLAQMIQVCQKQSRNTYGYRRVHIWLERQGMHKNPKNLTEVLEITMLYLYNNLDKELQKKRGKMDE